MAAFDSESRGGWIGGEMTVTEFLRHRLLLAAGLIPKEKAPFEGWTYEELRRRECNDNFGEYMDNRIVMGCLRYGKMQSVKPMFYDLKRARERLDQYEVDGNIEHLIDAANYCRCEFNRGRHPLKHFRAIDRE